MSNFRGARWAIRLIKPSLRRSRGENFRSPLNRTALLTSIALLVSALNLLLIPPSNAVIGCPTGSHFSVSAPTYCLSDTQRIPRNLTTSTQITGCPNNYILTPSGLGCQSVQTEYTGAYTPIIYCNNGGSVTHGQCQDPSYTTPATTYSASIIGSGATSYSCPNGGSLVMVSTPYCNFSNATTYYASLNMDCFRGGNLVNGWCFANAWYNPLNGYVFSAFDYEPRITPSCPSGGTLNTSNNQCVVAGTPNYNASVSQGSNSYGCPNGGYLSGSTCYISATSVGGLFYAPTTVDWWTCNANDSTILGRTVNNCRTEVTLLPLTLTYVGTCPVHYVMETATGDCISSLFAPVEQFGEQTIWTCTTTQNGTITDQSISTSDDSFSLNLISKTCVQGTNQYGITASTDKGYYLCQTAVNNGQIYSFTSLSNLSGKSSDSVTYCFYTGDLTSDYVPDKISISQNQTFPCSNIEDYVLWLACQYATI